MTLISTALASPTKHTEDFALLDITAFHSCSCSFARLPALSHPAILRHDPRPGLSLAQPISTRRTSCTLIPSNSHVSLHNCCLFTFSLLLLLLHQTKERRQGGQSTLRLPPQSLTTRVELTRSRGCELEHNLLQPKWPGSLSFSLPSSLAFNS